MKHTSGEWRYEFAKWSKEAPTNGFIIQSNGKDICGLNVRTTAHIVPKNDAFFFVDNYSIEPEEAEANAKLIAAAPELLEALEKCLDELGCYRLSEEAFPVIEKAKAAIKKATE
jgi:hypothetical protein